MSDQEPGLRAKQERYSLVQQVKDAGFSEVKYLRKGASGIGFFVIHTRTGTPALLKMAAEERGEAARTLTYELDVLSGRRSETVGLNQITGYPLAETPDGVTLTPTIRGLAGIRGLEGMFIINWKPALLLEWIEEVENDQPGYHRLDKLIPEKSGTWTDLEILDIVAPFAYLLAQAHKKGVVYNDIGADKADQLYFDEDRHQLKVIDWANVVFTREANYTGARQPLHDVAGLARLIYHMRTNEDARELERSYSAEVLRDKLQRTRHPLLANLIYRSLIYFSTDHPERLSGENAPITDGDGLYNAIEKAIRTLREESREPRQRLVLRRQPEATSNEPRPRIVINSNK